MSTEKEKHLRHKDDFYITPDWVVETYLRHNPGLEQIGAYERWLEPSVGQGHIINAVARWTNKHWTLPAPNNWTAVDINPVSFKNKTVLSLSCKEIIQGDFLQQHWDQGTDEDVFYNGKYFRVCMMNPPYKDALRHVEHALKYSTHVIALLRLGFMASQKRAPFHRKNKSDVLVLPRRPSFTGGKGTDKYDLAWFTFGHRAAGRWEVADIPDDEDEVAQPA